MDKTRLVFAKSCWEMLLMAIGQLLGTAERAWENRWKMPKGYWIPSEISVKGVEKLLLENAQITPISQ
jgi:hypothetical protein